MDIKSKKKSGSYYTRIEIVDLMLDLIGYNVDARLEELRILEPSVGDGRFLIAIVGRLMERISDILPSFSFSDDSDLELKIINAIRAIEIDYTKSADLKKSIYDLLVEKSVPSVYAEKFVDAWVINDDFLLWNLKIDDKFDFIIGNPPYIRIENQSNEKTKKYKKLYDSLYDRADVYVAFIEHGLEMLKSNGALTYICTDRFTKNKYGKKIRALINDNYFVKHYLDIHKTQPFDDEVSAYPCIFTISNRAKQETRTVAIDTLNYLLCDECKEYLIKGQEPTSNSFSYHSYSKWFENSEPWVVNGKKAHEILKKLEINNPVLEESPHNISIGIGVATGAKSIYLIDPKEIQIEEAVLLPILTKDDINNDRIEWTGKYVINPYKADGSFIDINDYPLLSQYLTPYKEKLSSRSCTKNDKAIWYKTIDRLYPERVQLPKLLIPDIKKENIFVKDVGRYYPEHSLYYITTSLEFIDVLHAILRSSISKFFIWSYATKMRGDYLRYQAQYLKKIRIPICIPYEIKQALLKANAEDNIECIDELLRPLYDLTIDELEDIIDLVD